MYLTPSMKLIGEAFAALETQGIIARANFWCCTNCASEAMGQEPYIWSGDAPVIGGVFFHKQNTEAANEGGSLHLNHGSYTATDEDNQRVADLVAETLREHGIQVDWDGELGDKMRLRPADGSAWDLRYPRHVAADSR